MQFGINVYNPSYYSTNLVVRDLMRMSNGFNIDPSGGEDVNGYPNYVDSTTIKPHTMWGMNAHLPSGTYKLSADGTGHVTLYNLYYPDTTTLNFDLSGSGNVYEIDLPARNSNMPCMLTITKSDPNDHVRNIKFEMPDPKTSGICTTEFTNNIQPFSCIRFMKWLRVEDSDTVTWDEEAAYANRFNDFGLKVSYQQCIDVCNELGKDLWINIPHKADDNFIITLAQLVASRLRSDLKVYIEYSNEVWNWTYTETQDILNEWKALPDPKQWTLKQYFGYKTGRAINLFRDSLGTRKWSCKRVVSVQNTGIAYWQPQLDYMNTTPGMGFDVIASSLYFGVHPSMIVDADWPSLLYQYNLGGQARQDAIACVIDAFHLSMMDVMRYLQQWIDYANSIKKYEFLSYECGVAFGKKDDQYTDFVKAIHADPRMGTLLYKEFITGIQKMGVDLAMFFIDCDDYTNFGLKRYSCQPDHDAPKYQAVSMMANGITIDTIQPIVPLPPSGA